ncbi:MAG: lipid-A-disaccharide synthase [Alphaproteobacteria bacterium]|nr:lipid-A-disaccharide synthase [Alphaproteobacteria bacterium]
MSDAPLFFIVAGEASGDLLGARLMRALRKKTNGSARFIGIGAERMQDEGLELFFHQRELAHMGLVELIRHLPQILRRINQTAEKVKSVNPTALITIDSPDFCFRVAKKVRALAPNIPLIHYVAPSVWAWRAGRAKKIAKFLDHLMALLPFEPPYFICENLPCTFVGHPIVESEIDDGDSVRFRTKYAIPDSSTLVVLLPGSRMGEVKRLLPIFAATVVWLRAKWPKLHIVIPAVSSMAEYLTSATANWPVPVVITDTDEDKYDAFAAASVALACSGTVSIELAMSGLPTVIAYKVNRLTFALYRRLIKIKFATLANIMHDRMVVPEFIQDDCTPEKLAIAVSELLENKDARGKQVENLVSVADWLGRGQFVPSERAAQVVLDAVAGKS